MKRLTIGYWLLSLLSGPLWAESIRLDQFGGAEVSAWPKGVTRENVVATYGKPGGVSVQAGGYDVSSLEYTHRVLKKSEFHALIRPKYQNLSDAEGWPSIFVEPGWLALDPTSKRIKFSQGHEREGFQWIGRLDLGGFGATRAVIDGDVAYQSCTEDGSGILFLDISDPKAMKVIGNCPIPAFPSSLVKKDHLLFVHAGYLLAVVDITDLRHPRLVNGFHDRWHFGEIKRAKTVVGDHLVITTARHLTASGSTKTGTWTPWASVSFAVNVTRSSCRARRSSWGEAAVSRLQT